MNLGAAYAHLTTTQLRAMLDVAKRDYAQQIKNITLRWQVEVTALKKALKQRMAQATAEIQEQKNIVASLRGELDITYEEIARLNAAIVAQEKKLAAYNKVAELEQELITARRAAS